MIRLFIDDMECDLAAGTDVAITKHAATAFNLDQDKLTSRIDLYCRLHRTMIASCRC